MSKEFDYLLGEYRERIQMLQKAVGAGNCVTFEEYKYACGQIRGLESACLTITDLKNQLEQSDE